jgi:hypothetical protein
MRSKTRSPYYYFHHSKQTRSLTRAGISASAHPEAPSGEPESESESSRRSRDRPRTGWPLRYYNIRNHVQLRTRQGVTRPRSPSTATASGAAATALEPEAKTAFTDSTVPELELLRRLRCSASRCNTGPRQPAASAALASPKPRPRNFWPSCNFLQPLLLLLLTLLPNILHLLPIHGIALSSVSRPSLHRRSA